MESGNISEQELSDWELDAVASGAQDLYREVPVTEMKDLPKLRFPANQKMDFFPNKTLRKEPGTSSEAVR